MRCDRANPEYPRSDKSLCLACFVASLVFLLMSCSRKQADSSQTELLQTPNEAATSAASTSPPATSTAKIPVMTITYQTTTTANQFSAPPGMRPGPTQGQEIRYLDLANNRMRLEKYVFSGSGKKLYQTTIIDQTGSYRFHPGSNEAVFVKMTKPVPVWNFDDKISVAWARDHGLSVEPGEWLGRKCDVVGLGGSGKVWLWNDIPLKKEKKNVGSETIIQASRIQEDTSIDASLLEARRE